MDVNPIEAMLDGDGLVERLMAARKGRRYAAYSFGAEGEIMNTEGEQTPEMQDLRTFMDELRAHVTPFANPIRGTIFIGADSIHLMFNMQPVGVADIALPSIDLHWMPPPKEREPLPEEGPRPKYRICTYQETTISVPSLTDLVMIMHDPDEMTALIIPDEAVAPAYAALFRALGIAIPFPRDGTTEISISSMAIDRI